MWKYKGPRILKTMLESNKFEDLPYLISKTTWIKTVWYCQKVIQLDPCNRAQFPNIVLISIICQRFPGLHLPDKGQGFISDLFVGGWGLMIRFANDLLADMTYILSFLYIYKFF